MDNNAFVLVDLEEKSEQYMACANGCQRSTGAPTGG